MVDLMKTLRITTLLFVNSVHRGCENRGKGLVKRIAAGDWQIRCCDYHLIKSIITGVKTKNNMMEMGGLRSVASWGIPKGYAYRTAL